VRKLDHPTRDRVYAPYRLCPREQRTCRMPKSENVRSAWQEPATRSENVKEWRLRVATRTETNRQRLPPSVPTSPISGSNWIRGVRRLFVKAMRAKPVTRAPGSSAGGSLFDPRRSCLRSRTSCASRRSTSPRPELNGPLYRRREAAPGVLRTAAVASSGSPQRSQRVMTHLAVNGLVHSTRG